jgi:hypothetical protein
MVRFASEEDLMPYILIQSSIFLRYGLKPNDFTGREAHYKINMAHRLCNLIDIMAKTMPFGEEDLCQVVGLLNVQPVSGS